MLLVLSRLKSCIPNIGCTNNKLKKLANMQLGMVPLIECFSMAQIIMVKMKSAKNSVLEQFEI